VSIRTAALPRNSWILAGRSVTSMVRHPEQFFDVLLQPVLFLVIFVYVLGGAISGSTHTYLQYVLPGLMIQTVLFSTISIGVNLNTDVKEGVFDRFRSLPIPRSAPLLGAVMAEGIRYGLAIVSSLVAAYLMGYRASGSPLAVLAAVLLVLGFALCLCWVSIWLGMISREAGSVQGFGMITMVPLTFGSSMFAKSSTMPTWLRHWVNVNPVSKLTDTVRALLTGGPVAHNATVSVLTALAILAIFAPLAVRAYRVKA
jgi:oleandomycin transport system permease protein